MNLLLDTHTWLWFVLGKPELSNRARQHIEDAGNTKFVSPASYWELAIKISLCKYELRTPLAQFVYEALLGQGFRLLHILPRHAEYLATLPFAVVGGKAHRDPFDRILIAQAVIEGFSIVTNDGKLEPYGVNIVW